MKKLAVILVLAAAIVISVMTFYKNTYVIPVLMYHSIDDKDQETKLSVSPESFARQMEFLKKNHYNVVTLERIAAYIQKKERIPLKTVAITFDDGLYNNYQYAYPVLKKYDLPATIFVIVGHIGRPGYLGWKDLEEMSDSGIITIGSHTIKHSWLPDVDKKTRDSEIKESKNILEKRLGKKVDFFCYPIGAHDEKVKKEVRESGYACAVTTNPGKKAPSNDIYAIKRIKISRTSDNLLAFWFETSGIYTWIKEHRDR